MIEASDVADLSDETDRRHKGDPTQRLQRVHHGRPAPGGRVLSQLLRRTLDAPLRLVDRVATLLQRDVLGREGEAEIGQPPPIRLRPPGAAGIAAALAQEERLQPMLRLRRQADGVSRARTRSRIASSASVGM